MPGYIALVKFTPQCVANLKEAPQRIAEAKALAAKMGVRTIGVWATLGEYDEVMIGEAPDDKTIATLALALASTLGITTQTMRAFSEEEFAEILKNLP